MRYYGWETERDYCHKQLDYFRHRPTHKWYTRYQHKAARKQARKQIAQVQMHSNWEGQEA